jgi:phosphoribosyl-ATP pyrophosphohydrolase
VEQGNAAAAFTLEDLARTIARRAASGASASYTAKLAGEGVATCARKFGEEALETVIASLQGDREGLKGEAADVLYHLLVLLHVAGVPFASVTAELGRRTGRTGREEKAARGTPEGRA